MPVIRLENIVKTYHMGTIEVNALRGVSCQIERGEMVAIMGSSGSGKSTLMNIVGCLDQPTSGVYELESQPVMGLSDDQLAEIRNKRLGFVFQSFNLLPRTSALANVELPMLYGDGANRRKRALEALETLGLADRAHHKPNQLSGGEQQRVAIARAMVSNPSIILADEPTGNLDSVTSHQIMGIFQQLNREGLTCVLVTHETDIAQFTQRIIRMRDGMIESDQPVPREQRRVV